MTEVQFYDKDRKELKSTQLSKSLLFVKYGCIHLVADGFYVCLPLNKREDIQMGGVVFKKKAFDKNYNSSEYKLIMVSGRWTCDCQYFVSKERVGELAECSHLAALKLFMEKDPTSRVIALMRRKKTFLLKTTIQRELNLKPGKVNAIIKDLRKRKIVSLYRTKRYYWGLTGWNEGGAQ